VARLRDPRRELDHGRQNFSGEETARFLVETLGR
jgi:hypothetical protein